MLALGGIEGGRIRCEGPDAEKAMEELEEPINARFKRRD